MKRERKRAGSKQAASNRVFSRRLLSLSVFLFASELTSHPTPGVSRTVESIDGETSDVEAERACDHDGLRKRIERKTRREIRFFGCFASPYSERSKFTKINSHPRDNIIQTILFEGKTTEGKSARLIDVELEVVWRNSVSSPCVESQVQDENREREDG